MKRRVRMHHAATLLGVVAAALPLRAAAGQSPFASRVVAFDPAPGQFVQHPEFNDPSAALGPPSSSGQLAPTNLGVVSLGGFGGSITLAFDSTVQDDPRNPNGLDAIVFSNAFWLGGDPGARFAEPATIEISLDANANGIADDPWFLIPGSHGAQLAWEQQTWDIHTQDATHPPEQAAWIPPDVMPDAQGRFLTSAWMVPIDPFELGLFLLNPLGHGATAEGVWGYADCSPTRALGDLDGDGVPDAPWLTHEQFYTRPDDPMSVGVDPGSSGGDAFDIAWAIDPLTGLPAALPGFDFIRLTSARRWSVTFFGEPSAEVDAVADVAPRAPSGAPLVSGPRVLAPIAVWPR